jgi:hypothetical protein
MPIRCSSSITATRCSLRRLTSASASATAAHAFGFAEAAKSARHSFHVAVARRSSEGPGGRHEPFEMAGPSFVVTARVRGSGGIELQRTWRCEARSDFRLVVDD